MPVLAREFGAAARGFVAGETVSPAGFWELFLLCWPTPLAGAFFWRCCDAWTAEQTD